MTLREKEIALIAGNYLSYFGSDEAILGAYRTLQNIENDHGNEFASDYVRMWGPLGTLSVSYVLEVIDAGLWNLDNFLEEYKKEI